jgi:phage-related protein
MDFKKVIWLANTRDKIKQFPVDASQSLGKSLLNVQLGLDPVDWKPFNQIGPGTIEIRVHRPNEYRLLYVARFPEAIYVLHVFQKKTKKTSESDIQLARQRYGQLQQERQKRHN